MAVSRGDDCRTDGESDTENRGGGLRVSAGSATLVITIISGNKRGGAVADDCAGGGTFRALGKILVGQTGAGVGEDCGARPSDLVNVNPGLAPLALNGGQTPTHALRYGSPAIDAGSAVILDGSIHACQTVDQRGTRGPLAKLCDLGAHETLGFRVGGTVGPTHSVIRRGAGGSAPTGAPVKRG
jgi:hypothetical protein